MGLEVVTYIEDLVETNPVGATDFVSQGDDHIRNIKKAVKGSFPSLGQAAVTMTAAELNGVKNASNLTSGTLPDGRFPATLPALSGVNLTALNASNLASGTVPDARFPATLPALSGVNLTALNASNLASGTVADGRLSSNVPLKNGANAYTNSQTVTVADNNVGVIAAAASGQIRLHGYHSSFAGAFVQIRNGDNSAYIPLNISAGKITLSCAVELVLENGVALGAPTSGDMGAGTFNCKGSFVDGRRLGFIDIVPQTAGFVRGDAYVITTGKTINTSDMAAGYTFCIFNDGSSPLTITQGSGVTMRLHGTTSTGNRTLLPYGFATIWCRSTAECVIMGDVT